MENYKCYVCKIQYFDISKVFSHLKYVHLVKDKISQLKCINLFESYECNKTFSTFSGLRSHLDKCRSTGKQAELAVIKITQSFLSIFADFFLYISHLANM